MAYATDNSIHFFYDVEPLWSGTVGSGGVADGSVDTIPLSAATNLTNGRSYVFRIGRVDANGTKRAQNLTEVVIGDLSGTNIINCQRGFEGTAQQHNAGTTVEILFTSAHWKKLIDGLGVEHKPDGTHGDVTADSLTLPAGATITEISTDETLAGNSDTVVPTEKATKAYVDSGWSTAGETWTYASASTITVPSGAASRFRKGDKIKLTQTTVKYFYIVGVADTVLTVTGGGDYTVANAAITSPYYSHAENPLDFPPAFTTGTIIWDTGTVDSGTGGQQPTAGKSWFTIEGNRVTHYIELGNPSVKNTAAPNINFTIPSTMPTVSSTYKGSFSFLGAGRFAGSVYKMAWVAFESGATVVQLRTNDNANLADNATIQSSGFEYSYMF
jgi:hypothetical protein